MMNWIAVLAIVLFSVRSSAETLLLRNGAAVTGKLQGMDAQEVRIERCGRVERYAREEVKSLDLESAGGGEPCGASSQPKLELPAGLSMTVRMLDYIDSQREPAGQVFRAKLETTLKVDGRVIVSSGAQMIVRMVHIGGVNTRQTLDLVGIQLGKRWARIEPLRDTGRSLISTPPTIAAVSVPEASSPDFPLDNILLRDDRIVAPSNTRLTFVLQQAVRLQPEGS
jgi:hypothetical protein